MEKMVTIGIPTRVAPWSLVKTVHSIVSCDEFEKCDLLIVADSVDPRIALKLRKLDPSIRIIQNKRSLSLATKVRQLIENTKTPVFVFTQDDLLWDKNAIRNALHSLEEQKKITMINFHIHPMKPEGFIERAIATGSFITHRAGKAWRNADNYLLANGRALGFRTKHIKRFDIPDGIVNLDAYLYFENKRLKGKALYVPNAIVYNRTPKSIEEHRKPSSRFQYSSQELDAYIRKFGFEQEYRVPVPIQLKAVLFEWISSPVYTTVYLAIFVYTRLRKIKLNSALNPLWAAEDSTKNI